MIRFKDSDIIKLHREHTTIKYQWWGEPDEELHICYKKTGECKLVNPYAFITDPQYGFLDLFNSPESPWSEEFWEWIKEKYLAEYNELCLVGIRLRKKVVDIPQMLTGYIIEFFEDRTKEPT